MPNNAKIAFKADLNDGFCRTKYFSSEILLSGHQDSLMCY